MKGIADDTMGAVYSTIEERRFHGRHLSLDLAQPLLSPKGQPSAIEADGLASTHFPPSLLSFGI
jgi:hypothetical protein